MRFSDDVWFLTNLGNVCTGFDYGLGAEAKEFDGINRYIRITDINEETSLYDSNNVVSPTFIDNNCIVQENDILFARTGASTGKTYLYNKKDQKLYFAGFLIRANVKREFDSYFIYLQTKTQKYKNWISIMSARSGQPGINAKEYQTYQISYPSYVIQLKISKFMRMIDKRIQAQSKIINNYESLIKWIRYCIFGKSYTIKNEVKISKLGEFLLEYSKKNTDNNLQAVAVGKYGIRMRDEIYSKNLSSDYSKNKVIEKDSLIIGMGCTQIDIGILSEDKRYCVSPAYTTYKIKGILSKYLNEYLIYLNPLLSKRYMIIGARQGKSVNKDELLQHKLSIHSIEEQKNIILMFEKFYSFIQKEKDILELYKKQKAYLLQNMFI